MNNSLIHMDNKILPFLKWPGGKRWLAPLISKFVKNINIVDYYEPFLGGGAVFFEVLPKRAFLSDINFDLINTYNVVKYYHKSLISKLKKLPVDAITYEHMRHIVEGTEIERAVRFLYLNRLAFGGMYRVNAKGEFNVPYGGGERGIDILWRRELVMNAAKALACADILYSDFEKNINKSKKGDFVYCDPTYTVAHNDNAFRRYNELIFSWEDQIRLSLSCKRAVNRGVTVIISNAANLDVAKLYSPWKPYILNRTSRVSCKKQGRRNTSEFLFVLSNNRDICKLSRNFFDKKFQ